MAIIVNSAWKSKKPLETVTYQGEDYTIGIDAFVTVEDAVVQTGETDNLVILDKKLTTPFMIQGTLYEVEGAATDIFMSTETVSKGTDTLQFKAAAGGTAKIESATLDSVAMVGFENVTSTVAGTFEGGKQDISATIKQTATTLDVNATAASTASGSLTVTDFDGGLTVGGIQDSGEFSGIALERIAGIHENSILNFVGNPAADLDEMFTDDASYANVTLTGTELQSGLQGGSITRKATEKTTENANGSATSAYTFSLTSKIGSGTATLTDVEPDVADEVLVSGFKTVNINGGNYEDVNFLGANATQNNSLKTAYTPGSSFTSDYSSKVTETVAATVNAEDAVIDGVIEGFSTVSLNDTEVSQDIESANVSVTTTMKLSVKDQKGIDALSISFTQDFSKTAAGTLTADDSAFVEDEAEVGGMKTVSITDTTFSSDFSAVNTKAKFTKKETGTALAGIVNETEIYTDNFNANFNKQNAYATTVIASDVDQDLVVVDEAYTVETSSKVENSIGGTKFTISGESDSANQAAFKVAGYKTVSLDNTGNDALVVTLLNSGTVPTDYATMKEDITRKTSYNPGKTYSDAQTYSYSTQAVGDATITGNTVASVFGFSKVTAQKSKDQAADTILDVTGLPTRKTTENKTVSIKAATKKKLDGTLTKTTTDSRKAATSLTASDVTVGSADMVKTVDLKNVTLEGASLMGDTDYDRKTGKKVAWKADEVSAEEATAADDLTKYDEKVTSWEETSDRKYSYVSSFKLNNDATATGIDNLRGFKTVDITVAQTGEIVHNALAYADVTEKESFKRTISGSKTTQNVNNSSTTKAVASLKVTGKADNGQITMLAANQAWNNITLKDAAIDGGDINANGVTTKYTVSTTENEDDDTVSVKVSKTYEASGSGKFSATVTDKDHVYTVVGGTMAGFSSITLSDNLSFDGIATNWKISGQEYDAYYVPFNGEYFDVIKDQGAAPDDKLTLFGNVSGSYTVDKNENVTAQWKASVSRTSSGSFTHTAKLADVDSAVQIKGYDKVTLKGVETAGYIEGGNTSKTFEYNYTLKNGDPTASTKVTVKETSSSSVTVDGTGLANPTVAIAIRGYKAVTLANTTVGAELNAYNTDSTMTFLGAMEKLEYDAMSLEQKKEEAMSGKYSNTAAATLTATDSNLMGTAYGFQTVNLTDTTSAQGFVGGSETWTRDSKGETQTYAATGSFTATVDADEFGGAMTVGNVIGYKTVSLTNSSAQAGVFATNPEMEIPYTSYSISYGDAKKHPTATIKGDSKGNTFTAAAVDGDEVMVVNMAVGAVCGYEKVTATNLTSIGRISNYWMQDENDNIHYGSYTASGDLITNEQTSASVKANGSATITGRSIYQMTQVTGDILGYSAVTLQNVRIGNGEETQYVSGDYTYTTKQDKSGEIIDSSETTTSVGMLSISNAEAVEDTEFSVSRFKDVAIDITEGDVAATFGDIIGGTTTNWDTATAGSLTLATLDGIVEGTVSGFDSVTFTNTSLGEDAEINGISAGKTTYEAKATVTFEDSTEAGNTIGGEINYAKTIVFKETKADDGADFIVDAEIYSLAYGDTAIILEKGKATMDLSKFYLNEGDELNLSSAVSELTLGGDYDNLETYFGNMKGASITGFGTIASTATEDDIKAALETNGIKIDQGITFTPINPA